MVDAIRTLVWRDIDTLTEWNENPNQGDISAISGSIVRFGFHDELNVFGDEIMAGNHRLKTLHDLRKNAPHDLKDDILRMSTRLRIDNGKWLVGCSDISHLADRNEAQAYGLANNRTTRLAHDDPAMLAALLQDIAARDVALMESTGFDGEDLDALLEELAAFKTPSLNQLSDQYGEPQDRDFWPIIHVQVSPETFQLYQSFMKQLPGEDEASKMAQIIEAVDATVFCGN